MQDNETYFGRPQNTFSFYLVGLPVSAEGACFYRREPCSLLKSSTLCVPCAVTRYKTTLANNLMQQQPEIKVMHH